MSNDIDNEKIVTRIKKLMALGLSDPDGHESKTAMAKAAELMEQYNIGSINIEDGKIANDSLTEVFVEVFDRTSDTWERPLGTVIARCLDCRMVSMLGGRGRLPTRTFLGTTVDVELAVYFYKFIRMQIRRRSEDLFRKAEDRRTYGYGCVLKVVDRLEEMYGKRQELIVQAGTTALALTKKHAVDNFFNEKFPNIKKHTTRVTGSAEAFKKGQADGSKIKINHQVGNSTGDGKIMIGGN